MLISKVDIKDFTQFTLNIEDRIFNHNILDAQEFDLKPTIGDIMFDALIVAAPNGYAAWNVLTPYVLDEYVVYANKVYKALQPNTGSQPDTSPLDWVINELGTFFYVYLRPFLVFCSYKKFLLWAGTNLTQYGLVKIDEDTSEEISDQRRAELIADVKQKANIWLSRLRGRLCEVNNTFDLVNYSQTNGNYNVNPRKTFQIRPVGGIYKKNLPNNQLPINQTENDFNNGN